MPERQRPDRHDHVRPGPDVSRPPRLQPSARLAMPSATVPTGNRLFETNHVEAPSTRFLRAVLSGPCGDRDLADRGAGRLTDRDVVEVDHHARGCAESTRRQRVIATGSRTRADSCASSVHAASASPPILPAGKQHDSDRGTG